MGTGRHPVQGLRAAVDVHYLRSGGAWAPAVVAADAAFSQVLAERTAVVCEVPPYRPGEFYRLEGNTQSAEDVMKLTIIAATGGVGRHLLRQAVDAGHDVTAVARNPATLPADLLASKAVLAVTTDLANPGPQVLESAVAGAGAVLSALGPHSNADAGIAAPGTAAVITAMRAAGVRRIVAISASPVSTTPSPGRPDPPRHDPGGGLIMRHLGVRIARTLSGKVYDDLARMEDELRASGLDWTILRPPQLTGKPLTGRYRTAAGRNVRGGRSVPRADVAHYMLAVLGQPETIGQVIGIAT